MKGLSLSSALACALMSMFAPVSQAATSAPRMEPQHADRGRHVEGLRFETAKPHAARDSIELGGVYFGPAPEATPDASPGGAPEIIVIAPGYAPTIAPAEPPSTGPRIIYVGKETPQQKSGAMPKVIYGDLPSRPADGPQVLYGN